MHAHLLHRLPARVIPMPRIDDRRYQEAKRATRERCQHLQLDPDDTARCVACTASVIRAGRSAATAVAEGVAEAKRRAGLRATGSSNPTRPAA